MDREQNLSRFGAKSSEQATAWCGSGFASRTGQIQGVDVVKVARQINACARRRSYLQARDNASDQRTANDQC